MPRMVVQIYFGVMIEEKKKKSSARFVRVFCVLLAQFGMLLACWYDGYEYHREGRLKEH